MSYRIAIISTLLLLSACDQKSKEQTEPPKLFADQREALDKAKAVGAALQEQEDKKRKELEQQTQ